MGKKIKSLIDLLPEDKIIGDENKCIDTIEHDSRKVGKNSLFVCIPGAKVDGHNYISQATS